MQAKETTTGAATDCAGWVKVVYRNGRWQSDLMSSYRVFQQFRTEAGLKNAPWPDKPEDYDKLLSAASAHGFGLESTEDDFIRAEARRPSNLAMECMCHFHIFDNGPCSFCEAKAAIQLATE
jgi:hypothetical protein